MPLFLYYSLVAHFVECRSECRDNLEGSISRIVLRPSLRWLQPKASVRCLLNAFGTAHHKNWVLWASDDNLRTKPGEMELSAASTPGALN